MKIFRKIFEKKKEKTPELRKKEETKEYLEAAEAIGEINWLTQEEKKASYQEIANRILELLPKRIKVLEFSKDICAIRTDKNDRGIEDSEIKDLEWAEKYAKDENNPE